MPANDSPSYDSRGKKIQTVGTLDTLSLDSGYVDEGPEINEARNLLYNEWATFRENYQLSLNDTDIIRTSMKNVLHISANHPFIDECIDDLKNNKLFLTEVNPKTQNAELSYAFFDRMEHYNLPISDIDATDLMRLEKLLQAQKKVEVVDGAAYSGALKVIETIKLINPKYQESPPYALINYFLKNPNLSFDISSSASIEEIEDVTEMLKKHNKNMHAVNEEFTRYQDDFEKRNAIINDVVADQMRTNDDEIEDDDPLPLPQIELSDSKDEITQDSSNYPELHEVFQKVSAIYAGLQRVLDIDNPHVEDGLLDQIVSVTGISYVNNIDILSGLIKFSALNDQLLTEEEFLENINALRESEGKLPLVKSPYNAQDLENLAKLYVASNDIRKIINDLSNKIIIEGRTNVNSNNFINSSTFLRNAANLNFSIVDDASPEQLMSQLTVVNEKMQDCMQRFVKAEKRIEELNKNGGVNQFITPSVRPKPGNHYYQSSSPATNNANSKVRPNSISFDVANNSLSSISSNNSSPNLLGYEKIDDLKFLHNKVFKSTSNRISIVNIDNHQNLEALSENQISAMFDVQYNNDTEVLHIEIKGGCVIDDINTIIKPDIENHTIKSSQLSLENGQIQVEFTTSENDEVRYQVLQGNLAINITDEDGKECSLVLDKDNNLSFTDVEQGFNVDKCSIIEGAHIVYNGEKKFISDLIREHLLGKKHEKNTSIDDVTTPPNPSSSSSIKISSPDATSSPDVTDSINPASSPVLNSAKDDDDVNKNSTTASATSKTQEEKKSETLYVKFLRILTKCTRWLKKTPSTSANSKIPSSAVDSKTPSSPDNDHAQTQSTSANSKTQSSVVDSKTPSSPDNDHAQTQSTSANSKTPSSPDNDHAQTQSVNLNNLSSRSASSQDDITVQQKDSQTALLAKSTSLPDLRNPQDPNSLQSNSLLFKSNPSLRHISQKWVKEWGETTQAYKDKYGSQPLPPPSQPSSKDNSTQIPPGRSM